MSKYPEILDVCCGGRMFHFNKRNPSVLYCDIRDESHVLCDGRNFEVTPDIIADFRNLPFPDETFYQVLFDPPHFDKLGINSWMAKKYGNLDSFSWEKDLQKGFSEIVRVTKLNGSIIFKWSSVQIPLKKVLDLFILKPVVGHTTNIKLTTHWVTFIKNDASYKPYQDPIF